MTGRLTLKCSVMEVILQSLLRKLNIAKNDQLLSNSFHFSLQEQNGLSDAVLKRNLC